MRTRINDIALELGFAIERTCGNTALYGLREENSKGEHLLIEVWDSHTSGKKGSLPYIWHQAGYTESIIADYWCFRTYVTNKDGACYEGYNPTHKRSEDGKRFVIDFAWHFANTDDNFRKVMEEILRRFRKA